LLDFLVPFFLPGILSNCEMMGVRMLLFLPSARGKTARTAHRCAY
jgi:hypothetical protein